MKKSINSLFQIAVFAVCCASMFSACMEVKPDDLTPGSNATLGFTDKARPDTEKYIPADKETRLEDQYIVQLSNEFLLPGTLVDTSSAGRREVLSKAAEQRKVEGEQKINDFVEEFGIGRDQVSHYYTEAISGFAARLTQEQVKRLLTDRRVYSITEDKLVQMDLPEVKLATNMPEAQTVPCNIIRHNGPGAGPSAKWIWIVDSGIFQHADLNVVTNTTYAKSFIGGSPFNDCVGHGTHVAGTAAAKNNSLGVVGMSAGAWVVPVRVLNCNNQGSTSGILAGINHVALYDEPGEVCNLSLGGYFGLNCSVYSVYKNALTNMAASGTWVVIASGNNGAFAGYYEPACVEGTRILTVGNMTCNNAWNWDSNYGIPPVDWTAVGTNVLSTWPNNQYGYLTGTSMSAPHVSGIVHVRQGSPAQCGVVYRGQVGYRVACR